MLTLAELVAPIEPPPEAGSGPVRESAHAEAVAALRHLEIMAGLMRHHLETAPRMDGLLDSYADGVVGAVVGAGEAIKRFQRLRELAEVVDLDAARQARERGENPA